MSLGLVSHILRIPNHLQTPRGITTFTDARWKARQTVRYMQGAAGAQLWGSAMPGFTSVPQTRLLGLAWAKGSYKGMRHGLHNQPARSERFRLPKGTWHFPKRYCAPCACIHLYRRTHMDIHKHTRLGRCALG